MHTKFATAILLSVLPIPGDATLAVSQTISMEQQMTDNVMQADRFWDLIGRTTKRRGDQDAQMEALRYELRKLSAEDIEAFERAFQAQQRRAYSWDLWGAAYVMNGGASDDGFEYFQRWLISRGRETFEAALADPDLLAATAGSDTDDGFDFESFAYVAGDVWREKTGRQGRSPSTGVPQAPQPSGVPFEEDPDHLSRRYPKLWAKFGQ